MLDPILMTKDLTDPERLMFQNEFGAVRKDTTAGVLFALFLGGFGGHHYYMGKTMLGVLYTIFFWTAIPGLIALIECFFMPGRVRTHNALQAQEIITKVKALR